MKILEAKGRKGTRYLVCPVTKIILKQLEPVREIPWHWIIEALAESQKATTVRCLKRIQSLHTKTCTSMNLSCSFHSFSHECFLVLLLPQLQGLNDFMTIVLFRTHVMCPLCLHKFVLVSLRDCLIPSLVCQAGFPLSLETFGRLLAASRLHSVSKYQFRVCGAFGGCCNSTFPYVFYLWSLVENYFRCRCCLVLRQRIISVFVYGLPFSFCIGLAVNDKWSIKQKLSRSLNEKSKYLLLISCATSKRWPFSQR